MHDGFLWISISVGDTSYTWEELKHQKYGWMVKNESKWLTGIDSYQQKYLRLIAKEDVSLSLESGNRIRALCGVESEYNKHETSAEWQLNSDSLSNWYCFEWICFDNLNFLIISIITSYY